MIAIRPATAQDLPDLRRVAIETQVATFGSYNTQENLDAFMKEAYSLDNLRRELTESGSVNYLAVDGLTLAGFMRLRLSNEVEYLLGDNTLELQRLYVLKKYHGLKVGATLMEYALRHAMDHKFEWMWLGVWERNFKAQDFYKRWGFERFSEHVFQMGTDPQTDWLMKRRVLAVGC